MSAEITLVCPEPSFKMPEALITFSPWEFTWAEPTAILTLVRPSWYHVLSTGFPSSLGASEAWNMFPSLSAM